jgi:ABC-type multidrug transport system fused ATPase/permease subunit
MHTYISNTWRLWKLLKPFHKDFGIQFGSIIIQQLAQVTSVYLVAKVLDSVVNRDFQKAYLFVVYFFSLRIIAVDLTIFQIYTITKTLPIKYNNF